jgi:hypothetical protein
LYKGIICNFADEDQPAHINTTAYLAQQGLAIAAICNTAMTAIEGIMRAVE